MKQKEFNNEVFEKDCLAIFEKLLQGYRKAKQSNVWESNMEGLVEKLTHLPTDPFPCKLMKLFDYDYLVLSESIESIIEKTLNIRGQMEHTQRFVKIKERYFSLPFLSQNTHLKRLEVFNNEGELCYLLTGKLRIRFGKLLTWLIRQKKEVTLQDVFWFKQKTIQYKELEIYYYSSFIDLSTVNKKDYYDFFCDYYGKIQFLDYVNSKVQENTSHDIPNGCVTKKYEKVLNLTSSQQVLWAYFVFRLMGLKLRVNIEVSMLTRFLYIVNNLEFSGYRSSYIYKLVSKAPYVKKDKNLLADLEGLKLHFQESKLPTGDIEKEILNLIIE